MDFFGVACGVEKFMKYQQTSEFIDADESSKKITASTIISMIIGIAIGIFAVYLSWKCNTKFNYSLWLKVLYAFLAYIFGLVYIVLHFIFRYDVCY